MQISFSKLYVLVPLACLLSCSSAERLKPPHISPNNAGKLAMELYDSDDDDSLSAEELAHCPAVLGMLQVYDTNGNGSVERDELIERVQWIRDLKAGISMLSCSIRYDGKPLSGAQVVFEPEPYLGDEFAVAEGTTDKYGISRVAIPPEKLPKALRSFPGLRFATYKVRITHPEMSIPLRYNTETTLGYESSTSANTVSFSLKSK